jgi:hypothetical protein
MGLVLYNLLVTKESNSNNPRVDTDSFKVLKKKKINKKIVRPKLNIGRYTKLL